MSIKGGAEGPIIYLIFYWKKNLSMAVIYTSTFRMWVCESPQLETPHLAALTRGGV